MGNFSKEWIYTNCNAGHHCLGVKLLQPVYFDGKLTSRLYITKVDDMEFETELSKKQKSFSEDFDGKLLAWAFAFDPSDEQFIELDMDNIDTISIVKR